MALFRRFFYRKPPDHLLEISDRLYVFDCCFSKNVLEEEEYKVYIGGIVAQLQDHYPDASFMVFNFREGHKRSRISDIMSQYEMTVMEYPLQYEGCPLLPLEMIHHFLRSSESWLSLEGQQNVLLMHCERGGWPVLAFMLAGLLLYRKQYNGEHKTLEMVYKQAPRELLHLLSPLNPQPSHLRYLQYISKRHLGSQWPPAETPLYLDCLILRVLPLFDGGKGCRPVVRVYGPDPSKPANRSSKLLFSTAMTQNHVRHYLQAECMLVKIDIHCHVQGDVVLECIHLSEDFVREEMMFRVMFHTAFVRSNILTLSRDEIDILWDAKDQFPKDFKFEVLFLDSDAVIPNLTFVNVSGDANDTECASPEAEEFYEAEEIFSNVIDAQEVDDGSHKEVWKEHSDSHTFQDSMLDDGTHQQVDDVKYKLDQRLVSDTHAVKDIAVDDGATFMIKEVIVNTHDELVVMQNKYGEDNNETEKELGSEEGQRVLDLSRPKYDKLLPSAEKKQLPSNSKPVGDPFVAKQKTKHEEPHGFQAKQTKPYATTTWIPSNKGSYQEPMHVSYPPSRNNNSPATLSNVTSAKDKIIDAKGKSTSGSHASETIVSMDMTNDLKSSPPPPPPLPSSSGAPPPPPPPSLSRTPPPPPPTRAGAMATRRSSLKPLHWSKVTRALQGSLWDELQRRGEHQISQEFDVMEIEKLFSANVPKPADLDGKFGGRRKSVGSKTDKIHLIDLRRANNTEIMLTKVKMPLPDMMAAVLAMDDSVLDVDQVENLIKFCPTKEEMELLKGYTGDQENLGKCEKNLIMFQYFLELMKVPRVESKFRVFAFKIQFGTQITEFKKSLKTVNSACEEVRNSFKLKEIMKKILYLGNTLNQGTARGSAVGFKLDSLLKLTDTRASNSKMTLMHFLCKVLAERFPGLLDFHLDLVSLEAATKIQLKSLAEEMQAIIRGIEKVKQELSASEKDGPVSEVFRKTLKEFIAVAESEVVSVTNLYSVVGRNADALALYFGEDPARCPFEQVTVTLLNFTRLFLKAHEENCKQAELEKKKADKEAEMEKVKGINLIRKSGKDEEEEES
uniref:Formin-like protein n=1 Tax=Cajanus cajan TaxID=3821 RepID=A0A151SLY4_CAJCA|nr:Formin-like protein 20 [Cajanus cajan]